MIQLTPIDLHSMIQSFGHFDIEILKAVNENRIVFLDGVFIFITNTAAAIAFGFPGILLITTFIKKNPPVRRKAFTILIPVALSAIFANILKYAINLPRPYKVYPFIEKLSGGGSPTFPSGHTADAFAFAIAAALLYRKPSIVTLCLFWASLVGYSRMCLGVHFPSDVLAGALIGTACAWLYQWIEKKVYLRKHPVEVGDM